MTSAPGAGGPFAARLARDFAAPITSRFTLSLRVRLRKRPPAKSNVRFVSVTWDAPNPPGYQMVALIANESGASVDEQQGGRPSGNSYAVHPWMDGFEIDRWHTVLLTADFSEKPARLSLMVDARADLSVAATAGLAAGRPTLEVGAPFTNGANPFGYVGDIDDVVFTSE